MTQPNFYITEDNFKSLIGPGFWLIQDLPAEGCQQVRPFLSSEDTLAVFSSGTPPHAMNVMSNVVAGIDWVRLESNRRSNEPPLNVYHFVILKPDVRGYPVYACREGKSIAKHWSELEDLDVYID